MADFVETWTGTDGAAWPVAWTHSSGTSTIQGNTGRQVSAAGAYADCWDYQSAPADADVLVKFQYGGTTERYLELALRFTTADPDTGSGYVLHADHVGNLILYRYDAGASANLSAAGAGYLTVVTSSWYWMRLNMSGSTLRGRAWADGAGEPGTWGVSATDSTYGAAGVLGLRGQTGATTGAVTWNFDDLTLLSIPAVSRVAVTTGAPASAAAFAPTLPTHATGDRLILAVVGKDQTTTIPTIDQSWVLLNSGTGGTGANAADTGQTFWAVYGIAATSSSMTAPTVTPGGTAPNSWEWIAATYRPATRYGWEDAISTSAAWVQSASDTTTASPLTGTAGAFTGVQPAAGDAILAVGVIPTDLGTALGATTLTATGLSGGIVTAVTTQYVENALGNDTAAVWADWTGFIGTASAGVAASFTVTGATLQAGSIVAVALRQVLLAPFVIQRRPNQGLIMRGRR